MCCCQGVAAPAPEQILLLRFLSLCRDLLLDVISFRTRYTYIYTKNVSDVFLFHPAVTPDIRYMELSGNPVIPGVSTTAKYGMTYPVHQFGTHGYHGIDVLIGIQGFCRLRDPAQEAIDQRSNEQRMETTR